MSTVGRILNRYAHAPAPTLTDFDIATLDHAANVVVMYTQELNRLLYDALSSVEASHLSAVTFYDFEGGSFGSLMGLMECEL